MCRALRVLCAARSPERLAELKGATVSSNWELVGGSTSADELAGQVAELTPDVVVVDGAMGNGAVAAARAAREGARIVSVGPTDGADEVVGSLEEIRTAVLGLPRPGGPVLG